MSVWLYRTSKGRVGAKAMGGSPVCILTVEGRTSGRPFSVPVTYFERAGGWLVVGSAGGRPEEPQWFKNLRATDSAVVEHGEQRRDVTVRVLSGAERDDAFAQIVSETPGSVRTRRSPGEPCPSRCSPHAEGAQRPTIVLRPDSSTGGGCHPSPGLPLRCRTGDKGR